MEYARLIVKKGLCRNNGLGDYLKHPLDPEGPWAVLAADTGNRDYNFMILIHELVEMFLTERRGIPEEDITDFDRRFEVRRLRGEAPADAEPGDDPESPYFNEHQCAMVVENFLCDELRIDPKKYAADLEEFLKKEELTK
jgi:hypothetical protein